MCVLIDLKTIAIELRFSILLTLKCISFLSYLLIFKKKIQQTYKLKLLFLYFYIKLLFFISLSELSHETINKTSARICIDQQLKFHQGIK